MPPTIIESWAACTTFRASCNLHTQVKLSVKAQLSVNMIHLIRQHNMASTVQWYYGLNNSTFVELRNPIECNAYFKGWVVTVEKWCFNIPLCWMVTPISVTSSPILTSPGGTNSFHMLPIEIHIFLVYPCYCCLGKQSSYHFRDSVSHVSGLNYHFTSNLWPPVTLPLYIWVIQCTPV